MEVAKKLQTKWNSKQESLGLIGNNANRALCLKLEKLIAFSQKSGLKP